MNKELENEIKIRNYYNKIREGEIITKKELDELKNEYKSIYIILLLYFFNSYNKLFLFLLMIPIIFII